MKNNTADVRHYDLSAHINIKSGGPKLEKKYAEPNWFRRARVTSSDQN